MKASRRNTLRWKRRCPPLVRSASLLVESIAGPDLTQAAYDAAVDHGYLWHEFGDSALLLPSR